MSINKKSKETKKQVRQREQEDPQGVDRERNLDFESHKKKKAKLRE